MIFTIQIYEDAQPTRTFVLQLSVRRLHFPKFYNKRSTGFNLLIRDRRAIEYLSKSSEIYNHLFVPYWSQPRFANRRWTSVINCRD